MSMQNQYAIGIKLTKDSPNIHYLIFVNNLIIFCKATKKAAKVKHIIDHYYKVLSQSVNHHKSKVQLSKGIYNAEKKIFWTFFKLRRPIQFAPIRAVLIKNQGTKQILRVLKEG